MVKHGKNCKQIKKKLGVMLASPQPNGSPQSPERPSAALGSAAACMSFRRSSVRESESQMSLRWLGSQIIFGSDEHIKTYKNI